MCTHIHTLSLKMAFRYNVFTYLLRNAEYEQRKENTLAYPDSTVKFYCTAQSSVIINQIMLKIQVTVIWCHVNWQTVKLCSHIQWTNLLILPNMIRCIRGSGKNVMPWVQLMDINILEQSYSNCIPKAHFLYNKVDIHNSDNNMLYFLFSLLSFSM